jgi:hypothetical protein
MNTHTHRPVHDAARVLRWAHALWVAGWLILTLGLVLGLVLDFSSSDEFVFTPLWTALTWTSLAMGLVQGMAILLERYADRLRQ